MKKYRVNISQTWSEDVIVSANNAAEAKRKAFAKWKPKKKNYQMDAEKEPDYY